MFSVPPLRFFLISVHITPACYFYRRLKCFLFSKSMLMYLNWIWGKKLSIFFSFLQALSSCLILPGDTTVISSSWDNHMCVFTSCWLYWISWSALVAMFMVLDNDIENHHIFKTQCLYFCFFPLDLLETTETKLLYLKEKPLSFTKCNAFITFLC